MPRKIKLPPDSPAFWPLEAEPAELQDYVTTRIYGHKLEDLEWDEFPIEPAWLREAWDVLWLLILAEADSW